MGTKLMTIRKCLSAEGEKTEQAYITAERCASASAWERRVPASHPPPLAGLRRLWRGLWGSERVCNCMAVWPALSVPFPSRIPVIVIRWLSLPNVSVIAVTSGVCLRGKKAARISSHHLFGSVLLYVDVCRSRISGV